MSRGIPEIVSVYLIVDRRRRPSAQRLEAYPRGAKIACLRRRIAPAQILCANEGYIPTQKCWVRKNFAKLIDTYLGSRGRPPQKVCQA
jgi:hypothetical protein